MQQENLEPQCTIFLCNRQDTESRSQSGILPNREHACRILHQTSTRFGVRESVGHNTQSAFQQKWMEHTEVCWQKGKNERIKSD